jgi:hypothetical protein
MEIIGDDKKLRALYSDAKVADGRATPGFTSVWHGAQARSLKPRRAFNLSFALVTALLVLTLGSLAVWSMYSPRGQRDEAVKNEAKPVSSEPAAVKSPEKSNIDEAVRVAGTAPQTVAEAPVRRSLKPRVRKLAAQPNTEMIASSQTAAKDATIDTWQSPTSG